MSPLVSVRIPLAAFLSLLLFFPEISSGQAIGMVHSPDTTPPEISHTPLKEFPEGVPLRIQAKVTDNDAVNEVTLNYRRQGDSEYQSVRMLEAPGSDIYSVDLPESAGPQIEYYIQAADKAGNTALNARADNPYLTTVAVMTAKQSPATPASDSEPELKLPPEKHSVSKWVWIGLGALAVGALASSGGGGGGGSNAVASSGNGNSGTGTSGAGAGAGIGSGVGTVTITAPAPLP